MGVKLIVRGGEVPLSIDEDAQKAFRAKARVAMGEASDELSRAVKAQLRTRGPAVPGQPPRLRKGDLLGSIKKLPTRVTKYRVTGGVYTDDPGAARLEWGSVDSKGRRTYPHPYLDPAAAAAEDSIRNILDRVVGEDV